MYWRKPRTFNERKQFYATFDQGTDYKIKVRDRRRPIRLWFAWDDFVRSDYGNRNWKKYRKKQWK